MVVYGTRPIASGAAAPDRAALISSSDDALALIRALGEPQFPKLLVRTLRKLVSVDHLSIVKIDRPLPQVLVAESVGREPLAKHAAQIYQSSLFRQRDPSVALLDEMDADGSEPVLCLITADDIEDWEYRAKIYRRFRLVERLSVLHYASGSWYALNLYRTEAVGGFKQAEIERVIDEAGLMATLVAKHLALRPSPAANDALAPSVPLYERLVSQLDASLTQRQIEVCARALMGMTNRAIAIDLGIGIPTVATLRKRAYSRLNISSLSELFALCLKERSLTASGRALD